MKKMSPVFRISLAVLGLVLAIDGIHRIYSVFSQKDTKQTVPNNIVSIGETVTDKDGVDFCVTDVSNSQKIDGDFSSIETDDNFIKISIKITNNGNEPYSVNTLRFLLTDGEKEFEYYADALGCVENHMYIDSINPGITKQYVIVYETVTPTTDINYKLKIRHTSFSSEKDDVYIRLSGK